MKNKKALAAILAIVMVCSSTTVTMAKGNPLIDYTSTTNKVDLGLQENACPIEDSFEESIPTEKKLVKPEIKFVNEDADSLANADISEAEAQKAKAERAMDAEELGYDADSIIVIYEKGGEESKLSADADLKKLCKEQVISNGDKGCEELMGTENHKIVAIDLNDDKTVETAIAEYEEMEGVICAEPNYVTKIDDYELNSDSQVEESTDDLAALAKSNVAQLSSVSLNDPGRSKQWYLDRINVTEAWDLVSSLPHSRIKVCILDTGCATNHSDLGVNTVHSRELLWLSTGGFATWPLYGDDYYQGAKRTKVGHGTAVTGVIGAIAGNSYGIAGVASCYNNDVLDMVVVDVADESGSIEMSAAIKALEYAREIGARVVNMSFSFKVYFKTLEDACNMAYNNRIVLVASAGNDKINISGTMGDLDSVIGVIATDQNNNKAELSNYGWGKDICAPGSNIYTTCDRAAKGKDFDSWDGTSFSAPIITATAAMMLSVNPRLTPTQVKSILCQTATDLGAYGKDAVFANGLVNAGAAVRTATVKAIGVYPIYQDNSIVLGCEHQGGISQTKYRWEYCNMDSPSSSWQLISDWNTSEWCTWYPDANTTYAVVCRVSYFGDGVTDSQLDWYVSRPQMNAKLSGTCVTPSGNGILLGCTSTTDKYYTALYVYSYATNSWIISASSGGSACWYQADGLPKGTYMAYFCTEDIPYGRKLSTSYYNFTVN